MAISNNVCENFTHEAKLSFTFNFIGGAWLKEPFDLNCDPQQFPSWVGLSFVLMSTPGLRHVCPQFSVCDVMCHVSCFVHWSQIQISSAHYRIREIMSAMSGWTPPLGQMTAGTGSSKLVTFTRTVSEVKSSMLHKPAAHNAASQLEASWRRVNVSVETKADY